MIYLAHEITLSQAESQRIDATVAQLNASAGQQDQIAVEARARADAALADAAKLNAQAAAFLAQADAADAQADDLDNQIAQKNADEPDRTIDTNGKSKPNPAWAKWKAELDALTRQRDAARAAAAAARASASSLSAGAAISLAAAGAAGDAAKTATANAAQLRQQAAQQAAQNDIIRNEISAIKRWQEELARQPLDRSALETGGVELASRISVLQSQGSSALDAAIAAETRLWFLQTLIQELTAKINDVQGQMPGATTELADASAALADIETSIQHVMRRQPE